MRRIVFIIASILVSAVLLWLALRNVPLENIGSSLSQADPWWVFLAFATMSVGLLTRAIRWRGLLDGKIRLVSAFHILNIGFLLNNLPLRAGEFARMLLATREKVPFATAATSVVFERLIDTLLVVIIVVVSLSRAPNADQTVINTTIGFAVAGVIAFLVMVVFAQRPQLGHQAVQLAQRLIPPLKRLPLESLMDHVLNGLKPLTHWRSGAQAVIWTLISWAVSWTTVYCVARALRLEETSIDLWLFAALALSLASFSIAIPLSVASLGPFQLAVIAAGQAVGLGGTPESDALALAAGFLFHGVNILGYIVWGGMALLVMGVSLSEIISGKAKPGEQAAPVPETGS
jgi:uncharacterized protein (TIRG00374 family)